MISYHRGTPHVPLTRYQRFVVLAAWLGLGFDMMEAFLLGFVTPLAIPDLLGLTPGTAESRAAIGMWTGILTSVMLLGWAIGGLVFGWLSDRVGRARIVIWTILIYSVATAAAALSANVPMLLACRFVAAIGIGGEWAAGVTLVAESVPEERRVGMGTLLATSGVFGAMFALAVSRILTAEVPALAADPGTAWRVVIAVGLFPAVLALVVRKRLREPEAWSQAVARGRPRGNVRRLFSPELRRRTIGGIVVVSLMLVTSWVVTAFLPALTTFLADEATRGESAAAKLAVRASYTTRLMLGSNLGALLGILSAQPIAQRLGRRRLFATCFAATAVAMFVAFGFAWPLGVRIVLVALVSFPIGAAIGSFHYYLTELFPLELRGSGASLCMNAGRFITLLGPLAIGAVTGAGVSVLHAMAGAAAIPLVGAIAVIAGVGVETRGRQLGDPVA